MADITPKAATKKTATKAVAAEPKAAAPKKTTKAAATKTPAAAKTTKKATSAKKGGISPEQRYNMIQEAAYYIAERDGFNGDPMRYWALAEMQIEDMIAAGKI